MLSTVDLTRARLLDPSAPELEWSGGIALESDRDVAGADAAYARAAGRSATWIWTSLLALIQVQDEEQFDQKVSDCGIAILVGN